MKKLRFPWIIIVEWKSCEFELTDLIYNFILYFYNLTLYFMFTDSFGIGKNKIAKSKKCQNKFERRK